jgi:predicted GNAT superfamily acetyltransferase
MPPISKIAVIGTINRDTIVRVDRTRVQAFGGILYNTRALSHLLGSQAVICPVAKIGQDCRADIREELAAFDNPDCSNVLTVPGTNNHCQITYSSISAKIEILSGWVGGVDRCQLRSILDADVILINFISGGDVSRKNLLWLRENSSARFYLDVHSRTLARCRDGMRRLREPPAWQEYVAVADFVQLNEQEFALLNHSRPTLRDCERFLVRYLPRARALVVTAGQRGTYLVERSDMTTRSLFIAAKCDRTAVDTTGCGDVFSGGFIAAILKGASAAVAVAFGNDVACYAASCKTINAMNFMPLRDRLGHLCGNH